MLRAHMAPPGTGDTGDGPWPQNLWDPGSEVQPHREGSVDGLPEPWMPCEEQAIPCAASHPLQTSPARSAPRHDRRRPRICEAESRPAGVWRCGRGAGTLRDGQNGTRPQPQDCHRTCGAADPAQGPQQDTGPDAGMHVGLAQATTARATERLAETRLPGEAAAEWVGPGQA